MAKGSSSSVVGAHRATAAPPKVQTFHGAWGRGSEGLEMTARRVAHGRARARPGRRRRLPRRVVRVHGRTARVPPSRPRRREPTQDAGTARALARPPMARAAMRCAPGTATRHSRCTRVAALRGYAWLVARRFLPGGRAFIYCAVLPNNARGASRSRRFVWFELQQSG